MDRDKLEPIFNITQQNRPPTMMERLQMLGQKSMERQQGGIDKTQAHVDKLRASMPDPKKQNQMRALFTAADFLSNSNGNVINTFDSLQPQGQGRELAAAEKSLAAQQTGLSKSELDILKAQMAAQSKQDYLNLSRQQMNAKNKRTNDILAAGQVDYGTKGQEAIDKTFGKEMVSYLKGGKATVASNLSSLERVMDSLGKYENGKFVKTDDGLTGPAVSLLPDFVRSRAAAKSTNAQQLVQQVVQQDLRETLGAQFTQIEGQMMIENAYNPKLDEEINHERLTGLMQKARAAANAKEDMYEYFKQNRGSLAGYTGPRFDELVDEMKAEFLHKKGETSTSAGEMDFDNMSDEELKKFLGN